MRVCESSPPSRTSLATGTSFDPGTGGAVVPGRSAADAPPRTIAPQRKAKLVTRTDMVFQPCELVLLHYGGTVNPNLSFYRFTALEKPVYSGRKLLEHMDNLLSRS
jgi:hypothetical protein